MPEVLRDPKLQQDLQFHKPTSKDAKVTCIAIRDMRFAVEWPQLIATQRFGRGFRPLEGVDPDQYQTITDSIQVLPTMLMAQVTSSFLPVRRSPIPNVMNVMYKGFEIDVSKKDGAKLGIGECYPSPSAPVTRILDQFTADKAPKVAYCGRSFCDIKEKEDYPVGYIYDISEPVSKMALSNQSCTITSKDWGDLNPIVEPHRGQTQIALYNSIYVNLELMAPMPRWVNLSDDQKLRIVAPIVGLMAGGQLHLACDISVVRLPANDWQIASGFSTKSVRYSEISMTDIESIKTSFIELTGHPVVAEYEEKPLNLMRDWAKGAFGRWMNTLLILTSI